MVALPVADLHCDLLSYLALKKGRTVKDAESHCSLSQLKAGNVTLQTMAIFTQTRRGSSVLATEQCAHYETLPSLGFTPLKEFKWPEKVGVHTLAAIENGSTISEEGESLDYAFTRFERYQHDVGPLLYISLTHNEENRFGGPGLTSDGKELLKYLSGNKIALDLSHATDKLAHDCLNYITGKGLELIPIASHSNFRTVGNSKRNLPDEIALEIAKRGGIIGQNLLTPYLGDGLVDQVEHALKLGIIDHLAFGADFFYEGDVLPGLKYLHPLFHEEFEDASCYPRLLALYADTLNAEQLAGLAYENVARFLMRMEGSS